MAVFAFFSFSKQSATFHIFTLFQNIPTTPKEALYPFSVTPLLSPVRGQTVNIFGFSPSCPCCSYSTLPS